MHPQLSTSLLSSSPSSSTKQQPSTSSSFPINEKSPSSSSSPSPSSQSSSITPSEPSRFTSPRRSQQQQDPHNRLAPFTPTSQRGQIIALRLLDLQPTDILYDLGSGDGRFLIAAALSSLKSSTSIGDEETTTTTRTNMIKTTGDCDSSSSSLLSSLSTITCVGIEYDELLCTRARELVSSHQLSHIVTIRQGDVLTQKDYHNASAIYLCLLPEGMMKVKGVLEEALSLRMTMSNDDDGGESDDDVAAASADIKTTTRVVSYIFAVPGWKPERVERVVKTGFSVYLYIGKNGRFDCEQDE